MSIASQAIEPHLRAPAADHRQSNREELIAVQDRLTLLKEVVASFLVFVPQPRHT